MKKVLPVILILLISGCSSDFWSTSNLWKSPTTEHCINPNAPDDSNQAVIEAFINQVKGTQPAPEKVDLGYATCLAEGGSKYGKYLLGLKYLYGQDVDQDFERAYKLFKKASKTEVHNMAIYSPGFGSVPASVQLIETAPPTPGITAAKFYIGLMYIEGWGVKQSDRKAKKWFKSAAKRQNVLAMVALKRYFPEEFGDTEWKDF